MNRGRKRQPIFYPSKRCILYLHDSGSNPCPSLLSHRPNPLRYRRLFLLDEKYWSMAFCLACFFLSCVLNEQKKTFADQPVKHGRVGCMLKDR